MAIGVGVWCGDPTRTKWVAWWATALALLILASVTQACLGRGDRALELASFAALTAAAPLFRTLDLRTVASLAVAGVVVITGVSLAVSYVSTNRWLTSWSDADRLRTLTQPTVAHGTTQFNVSAFRRWALTSVSSTQQVHVDLDVMALPPGVAWQSGPQRVPTEASVVRTSIIGFSAPHQFAFRSASLDGALAERRFTASIVTRSADGVERCGLLYLGEHGARASSRIPLCVNDNWSLHAVSWHAPSDSTAGLIDVILTGFSGPLEVATVTMTEHTERGDTPIAALAPIGVTLRTSWGLPFPWSRAAQQERFVTIAPEALGAATVTVSLPDGLPAGTSIWTTLHVEPGGAVRVLGTTWEGGGARSVGTEQRLTLWFDHPNVLAHNTAALGVTAIGTLSSGITAVAVLMAAGSVVVLTGSRTALLAVLVGAVALAITKRRSVTSKLWRGVATAVALVVIVSSVTLLANGSNPQVLPRVLAFDQRSLSERVDIWMHAVSLGREHILTGSPVPFAESWAQRYPGREPVNHAHNGLIDVLAKYGMPGFVGVVTAAFSITAMAWRSGRHRTLMAIGCLVTLNTFDATYVSTLTLVPLMLLALAHGGTRAGRAAQLHAPTATMYPPS